VLPIIITIIYIAISIKEGNYEKNLDKNTRNVIRKLDFFTNTNFKRNLGKK